MRSRTVLSLLAMGLVLLASLGPFTARSTPAAAVAPPLDLTAMALRPGDLPERGYGIWDGQTASAEDEARALATAHGGSASDQRRYARELTSAGWQHAQVVSLALPDPNDPSRVVSTVQSQIIEFSSAQGGARGFKITEDMRGIAGVSQHAPTTHIGDQALVTVDRRLAKDQSNPQIVADLTFQTGNLVASVFVVAFGAGASVPSDSALLRLAGTLEKRITQVRQGKNVPNLSTRALHLSGPAMQTYYDNYERLGGVTFSYVGDDQSALATRDKTYATNNVTDAYVVMQTSGPYSARGYGLYSLHVDRFAHQADAESWVQRMTPASVATSGTQMNATEVKNAPRYGDQSVTYRYTYTRSDKTKAAGYVVILRTGRTVASVQIDGVPTVSLATVGKVATAQATCQKQGDCRKPLTSPLVPPAGSATPVATPAAITQPNQARGVD